MRHSPLDWIARVVMLVLAGMVSLSIIGSIAAIPSGTIEDRIGIEREAPQPSPPEQAEPAPEAAPAAEPQQNGVMAAPEPSTTLAPPPPEEPGIEEWLEAITYALLALVGLGALAILIALRTLRERRRTADALEAIAARDRL